MYKKLLLIFTIGVLAIGTAYSQCSGTTPLFVVNLSSSPTATWTSPAVTRGGNCCSDNNCVAFLITLHPLATEISLNISSGAIPTGSLFYQVGCGGMQSVGSITCISGVGPHLITFCKPGNNVNTYTIASNPVNASPDFTMAEGSSAPMFASGLTSSTVTWTSIFPGAMGAYNSYLSCTACTNPTINAPFGAPPIVKYAVTGNAASGCLPILRYDTVAVTILDPPLGVQLLNFEGTYNMGTGENNLSWQTATEVNNEKFIIERSLDAVTWNNVGEVNGHGNSNTLQSYYFIDGSPPSFGYYRLVQKDADGAEKIFDPISIYANEVLPLELFVYPNPATGNFIVQLNQPVHGTVQLVDNIGKIIFNQPIFSTQEIRVDAMSPGYYTLILENAGNIYQRRIIIQ